MGPIETAIVTGGGALVAAPLAKDLLGKLLGPSAELLGDKLRENLIAVLGKAETMAQESGVELTQIPARTGVPILEAARLEDDDWLRDRWASLLFSAANPVSTMIVRPAYVEILKQLSPQDARLLNRIFTGRIRESDPGRFEREELQKAYLEEHELEKHDGYIQPTFGFDIAVENLLRLGVLSADRRSTDPNRPDIFMLTPLMIGFALACGLFRPRDSKPAETRA